MLQQWLALTLAMTVAVVAIILVTLATQLRAGSGFTGVGLVSLMSLGEYLSSIITSWTQMETSLGAVSRLKGFSDTLQSEHRPEETEEPGEEWPQKGAIHIDGVSASYRYAPRRYSLKRLIFAFTFERCLVLR